MKGQFLCCAVAAALLLPVAMAHAAMGREECLARLESIRGGHLSGDDQVVIEKCIVAGHLTGDQVARAYEAAKGAKK